MIEELENLGVKIEKYNNLTKYTYEEKLNTTNNGINYVGVVLTLSVYDNNTINLSKRIDKFISDINKSKSGILPEKTIVNYPKIVTAIRKNTY